MTSQQPELTVVVPVRNKRAQLGRVLAALRPSMRGHLVEVVIIDDHSDDDGVAAAVAESGIEAVTILRRDGEPSAAASRNMGLDAANSRWTLLLDADVVVQPGTLTDLITCARDPDEVWLVPTLGSSTSTDIWPLLGPWPDSEFDPDLERWRFLGDARPEGEAFERLRAPWVFCWTTAVLLDTTLGRSVRFDERLIGKGSEDMEFGLRLQRAGARLRRAPIGGVLHLPHSRPREHEEHADRHHERLILMAHPRLDVEMLCAFDASNVEAALHHLAPLFASLAGRPYDLPCLPGVTGDVLFYFGNHVRLRDGTGANHWIGPDGPDGSATWPLLGLALPCADLRFSAVVLPDLRGILPESLICRMFQEATRVGRRLLVLRRRDSPRATPAVEERQARLFDRPYWERTAYVSRSYHDWRVRSITPLATDEVIDLLEVEPSAPRLKHAPTSNIVRI